MKGPTITTARLLLRRWRDADLEAFAEINADERVTRFLPALDRSESDQMVLRIEDGFEQYGFGLWAVEPLDSQQLAGFVGLSVPGFEAHFTPCVEVGWRLHPDWWGQGIATEAAQASLRFGFQEVGLPEIVSLTLPQNAPSIAVMERIGMTRDPSDDFSHPKFPEGHPFCRHVLYRISAAEWGAREADDAPVEWDVGGG